MDDGDIMMDDGDEPGGDTVAACSDGDVSATAEHLPHTSQHLTMSQLQKLTVPKLKKMLAEASLPVSGAKQARAQFGCHTATELV